MKLLLCTALAALTLAAQDAKVDPKSVPPSPPEAKPTDRPLTELETLRAHSESKSIILSQKAHDIAGYQREIAPHQQAYSALVVAACMSVGVAQDKINTECGFVDGLDAEGKPAMDATGKPVVPHVWKATPAPSPVQTPPAASK